MIENNWKNFLKNMGEWQGCFTTVSPDGKLLESISSILNLEALENNQLVRFRLRRYGAEGYNSPPISDYSQEYRSLGRHLIFFDSGAFSKGSMQLAPFAEFGAEYGFVNGDPSKWHREARSSFACRFQRSSFAFCSTLRRYQVSDIRY